MLYTDSPPFTPSKRRQTRVSYEQNGLPWFAAVTNKEISQIIKQAVFEYTKNVTKFGLEVLTGKALSV